jgi:hypothetical protein
MKPSLSQAPNMVIYAMSKSGTATSGLPNIEQNLMPNNSQRDNLLSLGLLPTVKHNVRSVLEMLIHV